MYGEAGHAYRHIKQYYKYLSRQEYKTLVGQIKSGDIEGAMKGLDKVLSKKGR